MLAVWAEAVACIVNWVLLKMLLAFPSWILWRCCSHSAAGCFAGVSCIHLLGAVKVLLHSPAGCSEGVAACPSWVLWRCCCIPQLGALKVLLHAPAGCSEGVAACCSWVLWRCGLHSSAGCFAGVCVPLLGALKVLLHSPAGCTEGVAAFSAGCFESVACISWLHALKVCYTAGCSEAVACIPQQSAVNVMLTFSAVCTEGVACIPLLSALKILLAFPSRVFLISSSTCPCTDEAAFQGVQGLCKWPLFISYCVPWAVTCWLQRNFRSVISVRQYA